MATKATAPRKRSYNSTRRARQAAQTRADVLDAARTLFTERGWAATTLAAIADEAGVSVETIYNGFGSKKGLLRAAFDASVVGDADPVPLAERPEFAALSEGTLDERIEHGVALNTEIQERSAGLWQALVEAAASDEEIDAWRRELDVSRQTDVQRGLARVIGRPVPDHLITLLWVLYSPESYRKLVDDAGCTRADYEALMVDATRRLVSSLDV